MCTTSRWLRRVLGCIAPMVAGLSAGAELPTPAPAVAAACGGAVVIDAAPADAATARLQCSGLDTAEPSLQLILPGRDPLALRGVDGESLLAAHVDFDPASVVVRWLPGPPGRYWVTYRHARDWEPGSANIAHRRDLLVSAGADGRVWFDQWGFADYDFSRASVFYNITDDLTLTAGGPVPRLRARRYREESWQEPGTAGYSCEEACGAEPAGASSATCEREFLRAALGAANQQSSLLVREHLLHADGSVGIATAWARQFQPLVWHFAARPGEDPLTLLVLDDGAAGWLIVPSAPVDLRLGAGFDPTAPAAIPAVAACWLYNRRPWAAADTARPYPPAPAAALRADHAAPTGCCAVETSRDGQRVLIWSAAPDPDEARDQRRDAAAGSDADPPPRRLLAVYHPGARQCWSANLAQPGPLGQAPYDRMGDPVFSPDGRRVGWRAQRGAARFVVVDGQEGPAYHRVSAPVFSADRQVAYWARARGREFIVVDGRPGPGVAGAGLPVFSPTGGLPAWRATDGKAWWVMTGGQPGARFDEIGSFRVEPTGRVNDLADLVFSADGALAYAARRGRDWFIVRDGRPGPAWEGVGLPVFSPDGTRLAHRARRDGREFIVVNGEPGPGFAFVGTPVFSPDGRTLAHWASDGGQEFVVWDGRRGPAIAAPGRVGEPAFTDAGGPPWSLVLDHAGAFQQIGRVMQGDRVVAPVAGFGRVALNRRTGRLAWWERDGALAWIVTDSGRQPGDVTAHRRLEQQAIFTDRDRASPALTFSPDGRLLAHAAQPSPDADRAGRFVLRLGDAEADGFDQVGDPVFSPTGERLAYRAAIAGRWWPEVVPVAAMRPAATTSEAAAPAATGRAVQAPATAVLRGVAPRLLPHPIAVSMHDGDALIIGGADAGHWYGTDAVAAGLAEEASARHGDDRSCAPVGADWLEPAPRFRLYGPDRALGACTAAEVVACLSDASGELLLRARLPDCAAAGWEVAVAGPWDALPRRARVLRDTGPFAPLVRRVLDAAGRGAAPVAISRVTAIDLDGDGSDEHLIEAAHGSGDGPDAAATDYALLLLARGAQDAAPATVEAWWGGPEAEPQEDYQPFYADLNGDGAMEIIVHWSYYEGGGTRVHALVNGRPEPTPLGWFDGL